MLTSPRRVYDAVRSFVHSNSGLPGKLAAVAAVLAICEVAYLIHANHGVASDYNALLAKQMGDTYITIGETLSRVTGFTSDGRRLSVSLSGASKSLVFSISTNCPACISSVPAFYRLATLAKTQGFQVVFVSKDYVRETLNNSMASTLPGIVISEPTYRTYAAIKLARVPQTAVLSAEGLVESVAAGQLDETKERQIALALSR